MLLRNFYRNKYLLISISVLSSFGLFIVGNFSESAKASTCTWVGGTSANWEDAGNWSSCGGVVPTASDDVVIDVTATISINNPTTVNSLTLGNSGGSTSPMLNFNYDAFTDGALTIDDGDLVVNSGSYIVHSTANLDTLIGVIFIDVQSGSANIYGTITGSNRGYAGGSGSHRTGYGPGGGVGVDANSYGGGGASYGGRGGYGNTNRGTPGSYYGDFAMPHDLGSGGGDNNSSSYGGRGGGAVRILANDMILDGAIIANGGSGSGDKWGGGSGGSIYLVATGTLSGSGSISANGANGASYGGGGGGGRIDYSYGTLNPGASLSIVSTGGTGNTSGSGGTIIQRNLSTETLTISDSQVWVPDDPNYFEIHLPDIDNVHLTNNSVLDLVSVNTSSTGNGYGWFMDLANFTVDSGSTITMDGRGYIGGYHTSVGYGYGDGGGQTCTLNNGSAGGAGHGGGGGSGSGSTGGGTYDDVNDPIDLGSGGGGGYDAKRGASGGGALKVVASNTITIDGVISANGNNASVSVDRPNGPGSGGSINLESDIFEGTGTLIAKGGNGGGAVHIAGNGGGGIIRVKYTTSINWTGTTLDAANATPHGTGGNGGVDGVVNLSQTQSGYITNLPGGLNAYKLFDRSTNLTQSGNSVRGSNGVQLTSDSDELIAHYYLSFDGNLDHSNVSGEVDTSANKSFFHVTGGFSSIDGYDSGNSTYTLYVPKNSYDDQLHICPDAASLADVSISCSGHYQLSETDSNVTTLTYNSQDYWIVSGLNGTGAISTASNVPPTFGSFSGVDVYPGKEISLNIEYTDVDGAADIDQMYLKIQNPSGTDIEYYAAEGADSTGLTPTAVSGSEYVSSISYDRDTGNPDANSITITWYITLDWDWTESTNIEYGIKAIDDGAADSGYTYTDGNYAYENDLMFSGTLNVVSSSIGTLSSGDRVKLSDTLQWSRVKVVFEGTTNVYPLDSDFDVQLIDDDGDMWLDTVSSGAEISITSTADASTDLEDIHTLSIENIPAGGSSAGNKEFIISVDGVAPSNVSGLSIQTLSTSSLKLSWMNPSDSDFAKVLVMRKTTSVPISTTDGTKVYEGIATSYTDNNLAEDTDYYYTVFSIDDRGNIASGAVISGQTDKTVVPTPTGNTQTGEQPEVNEDTVDGTPDSGSDSSNDEDQVVDKDNRQEVTDSTIIKKLLELIKQSPKIKAPEEEPVAKIGVKNKELDLSGDQVFHVYKGETLQLELPIEILDQDDKGIKQVMVLVNNQAYILELVNDNYMSSFVMPDMKGIYTINVIVTYDDNSTEVMGIDAEVDPFGYVFEQKGDNELRINGANVELWIKENDQEMLWDENIASYPNPQKTDGQGEYQYFVEPGEYKLKVSADGYKDAETEWFEVENYVVEKNIVLEKKTNYLLWFLMGGGILAISTVGYKTAIKK